MNTVTDNFIAIEDIEVRGNYRSSMKPERLAELADNIRKVGVLEPILVRREGKAFILIAGARRLAATKKADLKTIPVRILDVDEKQAAEIQALENLHREDVGPIDEARALKALLDLGSHTAETLAERIDKSLTYVYRSIKLLDLPAKAIEAVEQGSLTTGHAHQLLRAGPKHIEALVKYATTKLDWQKRYPTVDELRREIEKRVEKNLDQAVFPKNCAYAGEIACTGCPFNTGNQGALFDGAAKGHCTNPSCFNKKTAAYYRELQDQGARKFSGLKFQGIAVNSGYGDPQIKGAWVVQKMDEKIRKAMTATPEKFRYGILKPSTYSNGKPQIVLVSTDVKLTGREAPKANGYRPMTPEEQAKAAFVQDHFTATVLAAALGRLKMEKEDLVEVGEQMWGHGNNVLGDAMQQLGILKELTPNMDFPRKDFASLSLPRMTQLVILALLECAYVQIDQVLEARGVNMKVLATKAKQEAEKLWQAQEEVKKNPAKDVAPKGEKEVEAAAAGK